MQVESHHNIDEDGSKKVDVPRNVHHPYFRRKELHLRVMVSHDLSGNQKSDYAKHCDDQMAAAHFGSRGSRPRILANLELTEGEWKRHPGFAAETKSGTPGDEGKNLSLEIYSAD